MEDKGQVKNTDKKVQDQKTMVKKNKKQTEELIVNLKYEDDPSYHKYSSKKKYKSNFNFYDNVDILDQSRFKFILNPLKAEENQDKYFKYCNIRESIDWDDIIKVVYMSVDLYKCPICLDTEIVVPFITRCGHIFCYPCIMQYFEINKKGCFAKCPICKVNFKTNDLKFCEIRNFLSLFEGDYFKCNLIMKEKSYPCVYNIRSDPFLEKFSSKHSDLKFIPFESQEEFYFSRILISENFEENFKEIKDILQKELKVEKEGFCDEGRIKGIELSLSDLDIKISKLNISQNKQESLKIEKSKSNKTGQNEKQIPIFSYFYQEENSDIYYLHPLNYSMLLKEYESENKLATFISGEILEIEMHQMTPQIQLKFPFLNHLKLGSLFFLVEINMFPLVSRDTYSAFYTQINERKKQRFKIKSEEDHYEKYVSKLKLKEHEKIVKSYQKTFSYQQVLEEENIQMSNQIDPTNQNEEEKKEEVQENNEEFKLAETISEIKEPVIETFEEKFPEIIEEKKLDEKSGKVNEGKGGKNKKKGKKNKFEEIDFFKIQEEKKKQDELAKKSIKQEVQNTNVKVVVQTKSKDLNQIFSKK